MGNPVVETAVSDDVTLSAARVLSSEVLNHPALHTTPGGTVDLSINEVGMVVDISNTYGNQSLLMSSVEGMNLDVGSGADSVTVNDLEESPLKDLTIDSGEASGKITTTMIIAAALIEGVALFGVVVGLLGAQA